MLIFFAAPLFSEAERDFNSKSVRTLRGEGFEVWLAQEHRFIGSKSVNEKRAIFEEDLKALEKSEVVLALLDGMDVDAGVAFEMGFAHVLRKPIFGLKTDHRTFSKLESVNLMLEASVERLCQSLSEVVECIHEHKKKAKRRDMMSLT